MFFNDFYLLQLILTVSVVYLYSAVAPLSLWLLGAITLITLGGLGLLSQLNIFIGFLWVIDLGVGLIFLLFLSHLTVMGETKFLVPSQYFKKFVFTTLLAITISFSLIFGFVEEKIYPQSVLVNSSWLNYYLLLNDYEISQLNLLREAFFYNNAWEFILINYIVLCGLFGMVVFNFAINDFHKRSLLSNLLFTHDKLNTNAPLFIRDQNFIKQQQTSSSVRLWGKVAVTDRTF